MFFALYKFNEDCKNNIPHWPIDLPPHIIEQWTTCGPQPFKLSPKLKYTEIEKPSMMELKSKAPYTLSDEGKYQYECNIWN